MKWEPIKEITVGDKVEGTYRVVWKGCKSLVIEKLVEEWVNITDQCVAVLVTSCRSVDVGDGSKYLALRYQDKLIAIYKPNGTLEIRNSDKYKIVKGRHATYSFNVFVKIE